MHTEAETAHAIQCAFSSWFGIQPKEAAVLSALWQAQGQTYDLSSMVKPTHGRVIINQLRNILPPEAIDTANGYRLTEIGMNECMGAVVAQLQILASITKRRIAA